MAAETMQTRTERLHNVCLALTAYNPVPTQNRAECSPGSRHDLEAFTVSVPEPEHQDLPAHIESPGMKLLDKLMAKLEFENELHRVCNSFSVNGNTPPAQGDSTGSEDSGVDEGASDGEEDEKDVSLMDTVLDMEQDYELLPLI